MALGKILLGCWTADIYLEDCLMIRSTGVDNEDCASVEPGRSWSSRQ